MSRLSLLSLLLILTSLLAACSDDVDDLRDLADLEQNPPQRQAIDTSRMGVNAFFNTAGFGTTPQQFAEIRDTLHLDKVRVLFAWTDGVQRGPGVAPDFGFFDSIIDAIPPDVDILVTVAHTPGWMGNSANWSNPDPLQTWVDLWLTPLLQRYGNDPRIIGWQIFNEPDLASVGADAVLGLEDPARYAQLVSLASARIRMLDPQSLVVLAASRSIQQNSNANLNYNKALFDLGVEELVDIWSIHYYGEQFEKVVISDGIANFLNQLRKPIWITESGEMGLDKQLQYAETVWPFLREEIPGIDRIYYYRFVENQPRDTTFALRTPEGLSNLYIFLRDR